MISPSHNPPDEGGFKYNPANGGPADVDVTGWIENAANEFLVEKLDGVARIPYERARKAACIHAYDYITPYVADLANVVDMEAIRSAGVTHRNRSVWVAPPSSIGSRSSSATRSRRPW